MGDKEDPFLLDAFLCNPHVQALVIRNPREFIEWVMPPFFQHNVLRINYI